MGNIRYSHIELVDYLKKYPTLISEIMSLHECFDLQRLKSFFKNLDLTKHYESQPTHEGYLSNKSVIDNIIIDPNAYSFKIDELDQDYIDEKKIAKLYSETALIYDKVIKDFLPIVPREEAISWLDIQPNDNVLEFGIGPGSIFEHYPKYGKIVGIDISSGSIDVAREKISSIDYKNISIKLMNIHETEFIDDMFDKLLSFQALCVVRNPFRAMKEIKRILKPNAILVIYEPIASNIEEVSMIQYLLQPIVRELGIVWIEKFPPYYVPYNSYLKVFNILEELDFEIISTKAYDPYEYLNMIKCKNIK